MMEWSDKPTEPGWYWARHCNMTKMVKFAVSSSARTKGKVYCHTWTSPEGAMYLGPLPSPEKLIEREEALREGAEIVKGLIDRAPSVFNSFPTDAYVMEMWTHKAREALKHTP